MADQMQDKEQQTEEATPKRKKKLRDDGKVAKSQDVNTALTFGVVALCIYGLGESFAADISFFAQRAFSLKDHNEILRALHSSVSVFGYGLVPIAMVSSLSLFTAGLAQTKGLFSLSLLAPKMSRLNPGPQLKRMLPGKESAVEILKQMIKIVIIGAVAWSVISEALILFQGLPVSSITVGISSVMSVIGSLATRAFIAFAAIAIFDYWLSYKKFESESKMSRKEIRDEHKEEEGDPLLKRRMRQKARDAASRRAVADVSKATVLITNPTHISIALRYLPETDAAPIVIAKGVEEVAMQMRAVARKKQIPIVEQRPIARALYRDGVLGKAIPMDLYRAIAEIIAHVMKIRGGLA